MTQVKAEVLYSYLFKRHECDVEDKILLWKRRNFFTNTFVHFFLKNASLYMQTNVRSPYADNIRNSEIINKTLSCLDAHYS